MPDDLLPSKFSQEDRDKLADLLFQPSKLKLLQKHLVCLVSDAVLAGMGPRGNSRKFQFVTSIGGQGSAYSPQVLKQSVPYALAALSIIADRNPNC